MYDYINGTITDTGTDYAVSDCGGVGYLIYCSAQTLKTLVSGEKKRLFIYLNVAEDDFSLYGFATKDEREMFKKLLSVSRIGKKLALSVLSYLTPADIAMAVAADNVKAFDNVPGMGRKTAQRVILELKEKVDLVQTVGESGKNKSDGIRAEVIEALCALGYDGLTAGRAASELSDDDLHNVETAIKKALILVSGRG